MNPKNIVRGWPETVAGLLLAGLLVAQDFSESGQVDWSAPKVWIAIGIAVLSALVKLPRGGGKVGLLVAVGCLLLGGCETLGLKGSVSFGPDGATVDLEPVVIPAK